MKNISRILLLAFILGIIGGFFYTTKAEAQLVLVNIKCKIVKVDRPNNRLEIRVHEGGNTNIQYVLMDDKTKFAVGNKEVTYTKAWTLFKPDMIIRVKGGLTTDLKVKARYIYF